MAAAFMMNYLPKSVFYVYLGFSVITFIMYAFDKSKAKRGVWRIPERTLHLLALFGGWPGAAIAQQILRHKSKKKNFRVKFWLTAITNSSALTWLISIKGEQLLALFE